MKCCIHDGNSHKKYLCLLCGDVLCRNQCLESYYPPHSFYGNVWSHTQKKHFTCAFIDLNNLEITLTDSTGYYFTQKKLYINSFGKTIYECSNQDENWKEFILNDDCIKYLTNCVLEFKIYHEISYAESRKDKSVWRSNLM